MIINLLRMDLHRLVRSLSFWIMIIATISISLLCVSMADVDLNMLSEQVQNSTEINEKAEEYSRIGVYIAADPGWISGNIKFSDFINTLYSSRFMLIICVIFIALFSNAEQKNGYIKNIAGMLPNKGKLVISKTLVVALQVFTVLFVGLITSFVFCKLFWADKLILGDISKLICSFGLNCLLHFASGMIILMLTLVLKNSAFSMTFGVLCSCGISVFIYKLINMPINNIKGLEDFDIARYVPETNICAINSFIEKENVIRMIAVGLFISAVMCIITTVIIKKRDIR